MNKLLRKENQNFLYYSFDEEEQEALLAKMSEVLIEAGFVHESYQKAVIERERVFPTGLPTKGISVAIPHTDSIHVKKAGFLVGVLEKPVTFEMMASKDVFLEVELIFMLAIKQPEDQLVMLQKLMMLCQDEQNLQLLKAKEQVVEVEQLLKTIQ
ncbi:PTS sugar transporter subunit IIA [Enterococcus raffinosus]|uniref:PTS sugar transporter subunit IIA n=1 Tax=Enterococcus raffinosus TaxID=71452 RepID=UPI001C109409|nr:PTS sugar transporter subunit IIA [Enterococcus raffinosus]MBU5360048.1 PTS sugar transporter subunit IIA [Enterococcus raffinosus]